MLKKEKLLNVGITNETVENILDYILQRLKKPGKFYIVTPNPEILVYATKHPHYQKALNDAEIALPDGVGVFVALGLMGNRLQERIPGVDFLEELCKATKEKPVSIGLLGGKPGIAEKAAECLREKYPWIRIAFAAEEWSESGSGWLQEDGLSVSNTTNKSHGSNRSDKTAREIDLLFVAFGAPKQEEWIVKNLQDLPVKAAMGVGGAFDYLSGQVMRAPFMIRAIGFEWLFRLLHEPWRWKRQLALFEFVWLILKEALSKKHKS